MDNQEELNKLREASSINAQGLYNQTIESLNSPNPPRGLSNLSQRSSLGSIPRGLNVPPRGLNPIQSNTGLHSNSLEYLHDDSKDETEFSGCSNTNEDSIEVDTNISSGLTDLNASSLVRRSLGTSRDLNLENESHDDTKEGIITEEEFLYNNPTSPEISLDTSSTLNTETVIDEQPPSQEDIDNYNMQLKDTQEDVHLTSTLSWGKRIPIIGMCVVLFFCGIYTWKHLKPKIDTSDSHKDGIDNALQVARGGDKDGEANVFGVSDYTEFLDDPLGYKLNTEDSLTQNINDVINDVRGSLSDNKADEQLHVDDSEDNSGVYIEEEYVREDIKEKYSGKVTTPDNTEFDTIYYNDVFLESISSVNAVMSYTVLDSVEGYILVDCSDYILDTAQLDAECNFVYRLSKKMRSKINNNGGLIAGDIYISTQTNGVVYFSPSVIK